VATVLVAPLLITACAGVIFLRMNFRYKNTSGSNRNKLFLISSLAQTASVLKATSFMNANRQIRLMTVEM
jgi:hypothetical protein